MEYGTEYRMEHGMEYGMKCMDETLKKDDKSMLYIDIVSRLLIRILPYGTIKKNWCLSICWIGLPFVQANNYYS